MRYFLGIIWLVILLGGCQYFRKDADNTLSVVEEPKVDKDLQEIKKDGVLRAIVVYSGTSYFLYRGEPMGYEYELLQRLAKHLDLELELVIAHDLNDIINLLNEGKGDLIAHGLTITQERKQAIDFTDYVYLTHQVLVQRKPDNWRKMKLHEIQREIISDPIQLIGDTISLRINSSYFQRLQNLEEEIGGKIFVDTIPGTVPTVKIIEKVVSKEIKYTMADNNIAEINSSYYPILDVSTKMSFAQRIAWGVRKNSPELKKALNNWIRSMRKEVDYYVIYNKYFKNRGSYRRRIESEFYSKNTGNISQYDPLIKKYASEIGWDWRFVSSIIYQESQFKPDEKSWAGARGLMQLMPSTARELGVSDLTSPEENIRAGTQYLKQLWHRWEEIPDSSTRMKFTLASYNCGYSHVKDAQRLAEKYDHNPEKWDQHVAKYLLKLSYSDYYSDEVVRYGYVRGIEPVNYVKQILNRYLHYKELIPV